MHGSASRLRWSLTQIVVDFQEVVMLVRLGLAFPHSTRPRGPADRPNHPKRSAGFEAVPPARRSPSAVAHLPYSRRDSVSSLHGGNPDATERREAMNLPVIVIAAVVTTAITLDHIKGPLFHDVAYCLNDGGAQTTRMCTGRVPP